MSKTYTFDEVQQHRSPDSCWVVLYGHVYDVTDFLPSHPGGTKIILQLAGSDATEEYDPVHPPGTLEENLPTSAKLGAFDESTLPKKAEKEPNTTGQPSTSPAAARPDPTAYDIASLDDCLNLDDIERLATQRLSRKAWAYYYSASDDRRSKAWNGAAYSQILLRPRVFVDCTRCDPSTTLAGQRVQVPFYVAPAAMARLAHPMGERGIATACGAAGALQIISHNASLTPEQIVADAAPGQVFGWQIYVQMDRRKSEAMLARVNALAAVKFVVLTLDAPVPGKREDDERSQTVGAQLPVRSAVAADGRPLTHEERAEQSSGGVGKALFAGTAPDLTWDATLAWLAQHTDRPIVLKGIQTHEDAWRAVQYAPQVRAIVLSNHGGRALDTAPPPLHTLLEIRRYCPAVFDKVEVWVDGGVRRGTDVVKALCLGARGVGIGRAPLFGLGAGGVEGVQRVLDILRAETETAMRLLGVERIDQLGPQHINSRVLERDIFDGGAMDLNGSGTWLKSNL